MKNKVESIRMVKEVDKIPFGVYDGLWGGYIVQVIINNKKYELKTENGVRGMNIPVKVISNADGVFVE
jgi:hypothetical protein